MRAWGRQALPYLLGVTGVGLVTGLIAVLRPVAALPNLSAAYLLLVLFLSARWGWRPAVGTALLAFLAYDWFLVQRLCEVLDPPQGRFRIGPGNLAPHRDGPWR